MSWLVVQMIWPAVSLLCPPQSSCCAFLGDFEVPLSWLIFPSVRWLSRVWVPFPSLLPLRNPSPILVPFVSLSLSFFFLFFYPVMSRVSCPFWRFNFFCQHSVDVLGESFFMQCVFLKCLWERVSRSSYSSIILQDP